MLRVTVIVVNGGYIMLYIYIYVIENCDDYWMIGWIEQLIMGWLLWSVHGY